MRTLYLILASVIILSSFSCATRVVKHNPRTVTVIKKRPVKYTVVRVNGQRYYKWNGKHYRKTRRGYVITRL